MNDTAQAILINIVGYLAAEGSITYGKYRELFGERVDELKHLEKERIIEEPDGY